MKKTNVFVIVRVLVGFHLVAVIGLSACSTVLGEVVATSPDARKPAATKVETGVPPGDLLLTISPTQGVYVAGSDISVDTKLLNQSQVGIDIDSSVRLIPILSRADGTIVASRQTTPRWVVWEGGRARVPDAVIESGPEGKLATDAHITQKLFLSRWYDSKALQVGTYRFALLRMDRDGSFQLSNMIDIKIIGQVEARESGGAGTNKTQRGHN